MDQCDILLTKADAKFISSHLMAGLKFWSALYFGCRDVSCKRWKMRPKHHYLEKIANFVERTCLNARHMSCFTDESYLGYLKQITTKCHSNTSLLRTFQRLQINLSIRFKNSRDRAKLAHGGHKKRKKLLTSLPVGQS